jgi:hypothetical protein
MGKSKYWSKLVIGVKYRMIRIRIFKNGKTGIGYGKNGLVVGAGIWYTP